MRVFHQKPIKTQLSNFSPYFIVHNYYWNPSRIFRNGRRGTSISQPGRTSGWIQGEAVETAAITNCTATVRATQHSSSSCGLVICSFTEQTPGKAVLLCYHKLTVYTELLRQERKTSKSISVKQHLECWKIKLISTH